MFPPVLLPVFPVSAVQLPESLSASGLLAVSVPVLVLLSAPEFPLVPGSPSVKGSVTPRLPGDQELHGSPEVYDTPKQLRALSAPGSPSVLPSVPKPELLLPVLLALPELLLPAAPVLSVLLLPQSMVLPV